MDHHKQAAATKMAGNEVIVVHDGKLTEPVTVMYRQVFGGSIDVMEWRQRMQPEHSYSTWVSRCTSPQRWCQCVVGWDYRTSSMSE